MNFAHLKQKDNFGYRTTYEGNKPRYRLDATKERLYAQDTAEPIIIYWDETWIAEPETAML
jgi:hypothetical protein